MIIGIIGGGQLGLMMAEAAHQLNHTVYGLDPNPNCPLSKKADTMITANYNDKKAFKQLVNSTDVLTYEFENVDLTLIEKYTTKIPQKAKALKKSKHRLIEKNYARKLHIPIPSYKQYTSKEDLFIPAIIKTTTGGYDGKGQYIIQSKKDIDQININLKNDYIIEELVAFDYEISCIATRDNYQTINYQPIPKNRHKNGILHISDLTEKIPETIAQKARDYTKKLINDLDYVGTLAVEFFVKGQAVIFNEFAPRPHNSGHYSIEGSTTSQFTNHILAITNEKSKKPTMINPTAMLNILGQDMVLAEKSNVLSNTYTHLYFKDDIRKNRKMGHITIVSKDKQYVQDTLQELIEEIQ
ncbi:MAG: 5-(carboxyamino)imidazole ribonucleotide synthase [Candidatus Izimaplasma sp.]|nr:5-(carboxyamino)imidazole ribonucleotide synthase [Candidatus Izimaplasma bacterium]